MESKVLVLMNLIVCLAGGFICICRMSMMSKSSTRPEIRWQYVFRFTVFVASGISWTYDDPATIAQLLLSSSILTHLLLEKHLWKNGAPSFTRRGMA